MTVTNKLIYPTADTTFKRPACKNFIVPINFPYSACISAKFALKVSAIALKAPALSARS